MTPFRQILAVVLCLAATPGAALAQEYQPGRVPHASVADVRALPEVNYPVVLTGYLISKSGDETYMFQDDSGAIQAKVPAEALYNITVDGKRLTLRGAVGRQGETTEIAVDSVSQAE